jgi:hydrogenase maturation protease
MRTLIIGYGNTLRRDDGVGYRVVEVVASWNLPHVDAISCHQLTPELAANLGACDRVIFVDAALPGTQSQVTIQGLAQPSKPGLNTHDCNPSELLSLAAILYGARPEAYQMLLPTAIAVCRLVKYSSNSG